MNIEEAKEKLFRKGFEKDLYPELEKWVDSGQEEGILSKTKKVDEDEVTYTLHLRHDTEKGEIYFNKYHAAVKLADGELRDHTFSADRQITAMEAYRMLKLGDKVSVNKDLFSEDKKYNTWLSLAVDQPKNEFGNYEYNSYHQNYYIKYPFVLKDELGKVEVPVKQLENPSNFEWIEKALKKANLIPVVMMIGGAEVSGFLGVNPEKGKVVLYDEKIQLIERVGQHQNELKGIDTFKADENSQTTAATPQNEEVKKKSWDKPRVDWKKTQGKGQSI